MSYLTQSHIASNGAMNDRLAQAAATEGFAEPDSWASNNRRVWASQPGWDSAWESAEVNHPNDPGYDPGTDEAVITDGMILSAVQSIGEGTP